MAAELRDYSKLPWALLCDIMFKISHGSGNDILLGREVCKEWCAAVETTVLEMKIVENHSPHKVLSGFAKFEHLQRVHIEDCKLSSSVYWTEEFEQVSENCVQTVREYSSEGRISGAWVEVFEAMGANCRNLKDLHIVNVLPHLEAVDAMALFTNCDTVEALELSCSTSLAQLPSSDHMTALTSLTISSDSTLTALSPLAPNLRVMVVERCGQLRHLRPLGLLQELTVHFCYGLKHLDITGLSALRSLSIKRCSELQSISGLGPNMHLQKFWPTECEDLKPGPDLTGMHTLQEASVSIAESSELQRLKALPVLRRLQLSFTGDPISLPDWLSRLEDLALIFTEMDAIPEMTKLSSLRSVTLSSCSILHAHGLTQIPTIQHLRISRCRQMRALPCFSRISELHSLIVDDCPLVEDVPQLNALAHLTRVEFISCDGIRTIPPFDEMPQLRSLRFKWCRLFQSLPSIASLQLLTQLNLIGCTALREVPALPSGLLYLELEHCESLSHLPPLEALVSLKDLSLGGCSGLQRLPSLLALGSLQKLTLQYCSGLMQLPSLEGLTSLRVLDLTGCDSLACLPSLTGMKRLRTLRICQCLRHSPSLKGLCAEVEMQVHSSFGTTSES